MLFLWVAYHTNQYVNPGSVSFFPERLQLRSLDAGGGPTKNCHKFSELKPLLLKYLQWNLSNTLVKETEAC